MFLRTVSLGIFLAAAALSVSAQERPVAPAPHVAFAFEPGLNSLASIGGFAVSYYPVDRVAVDAGAGFGVSNWRFGVRARAFFLEWKKLHPYAGLSYSHALGWGNDTLSMGVDVTRNGDTHHYDFGMTVDPTDFLGIQGGVEFRFGHFILRPGLGWTVQLGGRNWHVVEGEGPVGEDKKSVDLIEGGGPLACIGIGFGF
jgi:hypothetical protein